MRTTLFVFYLAVASWLAAVPALAQDAGTFRTGFVLLSDYAHLESHGGTRASAGPLEGGGFILESSAAPWDTGAIGRVSCVAFVRTDADGANLTGYCNMTDTGGDTWFGQTRRRDFNPSGGGDGVLEILGGTGKYAGIKGSCAYTVGALPDRWLTVKAACDWKRE